MASRSTCKESRQRRIASIDAAPVMNTSGTANHSTCQPPRPRSSSIGRADDTVATAPAHASAEAMAGRVEGFRFPAMLDEPPERTLISAISVEQRMATSVRDLGHASGELTDQRTRLDHTMAVGVPRRHRTMQAEPCRKICTHCRPVRAKALERADRTAQLDAARRLGGAQLAGQLRDGSSQCAACNPNVVGRACCMKVRPIIGVSRCSRVRVGQPVGHLRHVVVDGL